MESTTLLDSYLRRLHLPGFAQHYAQVAEDAARANLSYDRFLLALAEQAGLGALLPLGVADALMAPAVCRLVEACRPIGDELGMRSFDAVLADVLGERRTDDAALRVDANPELAGGDSFGADRLHQPPRWQRGDLRHQGGRHESAPHHQSPGTR